MLISYVDFCKILACIKSEIEICSHELPFLVRQFSNTTSNFEWSRQKSQKMHSLTSLLFSSSHTMLFNLKSVSLPNTISWTIIKFINNDFYWNHFSYMFGMQFLPMIFAIITLLNCSLKSLHLAFGHINSWEASAEDPFSLNLKDPFSFDTFSSLGHHILINFLPVLLLIRDCTFDFDCFPPLHGLFWFMMTPSFLKYSLFIQFHVCTKCNCSWPCYLKYFFNF